MSNPQDDDSSTPRAAKASPSVPIMGQVLQSYDKFNQATRAEQKEWCTGSKANYANNNIWVEDDPKMPCQLRPDVSSLCETSSVGKKVVPGLGHHADPMWCMGMQHACFTAKDPNSEERTPQCYLNKDAALCSTNNIARIYAFDGEVSQEQCEQSNHCYKQCVGKNCNGGNYTSSRTPSCFLKADDSCFIQPQDRVAGLGVLNAAGGVIDLDERACVSQEFNGYPTNCYKPCQGKACRGFACYYKNTTGMCSDLNASCIAGQMCAKNPAYECKNDMNLTGCNVLEKLKSQSTQRQCSKQSDGTYQLQLKMGNDAWKQCMGTKATYATLDECSSASADWVERCSNVYQSLAKGSNFGASPICCKTPPCWHAVPPLKDDNCYKYTPPAKYDPDKRTYCTREMSCDECAAMGGLPTKGKDSKFLSSEGCATPGWCPPDTWQDLYVTSETYSYPQSALKWCEQSVLKQDFNKYNRHGDLLEWCTQLINKCSGKNTQCQGNPIPILGQQCQNTPTFTCKSEPNPRLWCSEPPCWVENPKEKSCEFPSCTLDGHATEEECTKAGGTWSAQDCVLENQLCAKGMVCQEVKGELKWMAIPSDTPPELETCPQISKPQAGVSTQCNYVGQTCKVMPKWECKDEVNLQMGCFSPPCWVGPTTNVTDCSPKMSSRFLKMRGVVHTWGDLVSECTTFQQDRTANHCLPSQEPGPNGDDPLGKVCFVSSCTEKDPDCGKGDVYQCASSGKWTKQASIPYFSPTTKEAQDLYTPCEHLGQRTENGMTPSNIIPMPATCQIVSQPVGTCPASTSCWIPDAMPTTCSSSELNAICYNADSKIPGNGVRSLDATKVTAEEARDPTLNPSTGYTCLQKQTAVCPSPPCWVPQPFQMEVFNCDVLKGGLGDPLVCPAAGAKHTCKEGQWCKSVDGTTSQCVDGTFQPFTDSMPPEIQECAATDKSGASCPHIGQRCWTKTTETSIPDVNILYCDASKKWGPDMHSGTPCTHKLQKCVNSVTTPTNTFFHEYRCVEPPPQPGSSPAPALEWERIWQRPAAGEISTNLISILQGNAVTAQDASAKNPFDRCINADKGKIIGGGGIDWACEPYQPHHPVLKMNEQDNTTTWAASNQCFLSTDTSTDDPPSYTYKQILDKATCTKAGGSWEPYSQGSGPTQWWCNVPRDKCKPSQDLRLQWVIERPVQTTVCEEPPCWITAPVPPSHFCPNQVECEGGAGDACTEEGSMCHRLEPTIGNVTYRCIKKKLVPYPNRDDKKNDVCCNPVYNFGNDPENSGLNCNYANQMCLDPNESTVDGAKINKLGFTCLRQPYYVQSNCTTDGQSSCGSLGISSTNTGTSTGGTPIPVGSEKWCQSNCGSNHNPTGDTKKNCDQYCFCRDNCTPLCRPNMSNAGSALWDGCWHPNPPPPTASCPSWQCEHANHICTVGSGYTCQAGIKSCGCPDDKPCMPCDKDGNCQGDPNSPGDTSACVPYVGGHAAGTAKGVCPGGYQDCSRGAGMRWVPNMAIPVEHGAFESYPSLVDECPATTCTYEGQLCSKGAGYKCENTINFQTGCFTPPCWTQLSTSCTRVHTYSNNWVDHGDTSLVYPGDCVLVPSTAGGDGYVINANTTETFSLGSVLYKYKGLEVVPKLRIDPKTAMIPGSLWFDKFMRDPSPTTPLYCQTNESPYGSCPPDKPYIQNLSSPGESPTYTCCADLSCAAPSDANGIPVLAIRAPTAQEVENYAIPANSIMVVVREGSASAQLLSLSAQRLSVNVFDEASKRLQTCQLAPCSGKDERSSSTKTTHILCPAGNPGTSMVRLDCSDGTTAKEVEKGVILHPARCYLNKGSANVKNSDDITMCPDISFALPNDFCAQECRCGDGYALKTTTDSDGQPQQGCSPAEGAKRDARCARCFCQSSLLPFGETSDLWQQISILPAGQGVMGQKLGYYVRNPHQLPKSSSMTQVGAPLTTHDPLQCEHKCNQQTGCVGFVRKGDVCTFYKPAKDGACLNCKKQGDCFASTEGVWYYKAC